MYIRVLPNPGSGGSGAASSFFVFSARAIPYRRHSAAPRADDPRMDGDFVLV